MQRWPAMSEPTPDEKPRKRRVPVGRPDPIGGHRRFIEADEDAAGQWDESQWHDSPPL